MTNLEKRDCARLEQFIRNGWGNDAGFIARSLSASIRAARTNKSRNELITFAANWPAAVQHIDFII